MTADPAVKRSVDRKPAIAGGRGRQDVDQNDVAIDRNAAAHRGVHAAADGVGVAPELGPVEQENRPGDDERRHDDRIGQDDVHAAQKLAADLRPLKEIEPAALAGDVVDERVVAVGANAGGKPITVVFSLMR